MRPRLRPPPVTLGRSQYARLQRLGEELSGETAEKNNSSVRDAIKTPLTIAGRRTVLRALGHKELRVIADTDLVAVSQRG